MRAAILLSLLLAVSSAHLGEEETGPEQHPPLDIILDNPASLIIAFIIFGLVALIFRAMFPLEKKGRLAFLILALVISLIFLALIALSLTREPAGPAPYHTHADFKVYLDGVPFDFSEPGYMSNPNSTLSQMVHLHDLDGGIIHHHARNLTMGDFFSSLGFVFNSTCFVTDRDASYCDDGNRTLRMFVMHYGGRWEENGAMEGYVFQDMDRILITYGDPSVPVTDQLQSVGDRACIQSEKCPERGEPSNESTCAGDFCLA